MVTERPGPKALPSLFTTSERATCKEYSVPLLLNRRVALEKSMRPQLNKEVLQSISSQSTQLDRKVFLNESLVTTDIQRRFIKIIPHFIVLVHSRQHWSCLGLTTLFEKCCLFVYLEGSPLALP